MAFQNIFILGATGNVGTELIKQIETYDGANHEHRNPTNIVGIADSSHYILSPGGVSIPETISKATMKDSFSQDDGSIAYSTHEQIIDAVKKSGMEGEIVFVDVTAEDQKMIDLHKFIISQTANRIITANKKPAAASMDIFESITGNPHRYRYNTTVMAGAGAVPYFQEAHGLSEKIQSVEGTFSGTLAYVCSELEKGEKSFSQIVIEAKAQGYTEPHPIDDLNGEDVKRKLLILLRSAGVRIEQEEVKLDGLINPANYENMNVDTFLKVIEQEDYIMKDVVLSNLKEGSVPRYIASYRQESGEMIARVGLQFVPKDSELGSLKGTANKVLIHTSQRTPLGTTPHIISSPGAGVPKTAASVRADLLYLLNGTNLWQHN